MINHDDVMRLASVAKIGLSDDEAGDIRLYIAEALELADYDSNAAGYADSMDSCREMPLTVAGLREDTPVRGALKEKIIEQSPSGSADGFTIRRLLE